MESRPTRGRSRRAAAAGADEAILARFAAIRVWTRGGERAALQHDLDIAPWRHNPRVTVIREVGAQGGLP